MCSKQQSGIADIPPYNRNYDVVSYDHYEITVLADTNTYYDSARPRSNYSTDIKVDSKISSNGGILASITSEASVTISSVDLICVFYKDGSAVGASTDYLYDFMDGQTAEFAPPFDSDYLALEYNDYEIFVNYASIY